MNGCHLADRCSEPASGRAHGFVEQLCAAGLPSAKPARQQNPARAVTRWPTLAATMLALLLAVLGGCDRFRSSSDQELVKNLRLTLTCTTQMYPGKVSFQLYFSSVGDPIWPGGRPVELFANERPLSAPRDWDLYGEINSSYYGFRRSYLWHPTPRELAEWLGGAGTYLIVARLGPVQSTVVRLSVSSGGVVEIQESSAPPPRGP